MCLALSPLVSLMYQAKCINLRVNNSPKCFQPNLDTCASPYPPWLVSCIERSVSIPEWATPQGYILSEKIGQNFHPSESCFFVINYQHWTGRSAFGPFLALLDHGGGLGGPGGVMRGLKTLKMTLSIGDHLRPWNAMFWVVTTSYTMFSCFGVKTGPSVPKKGRFWPK